MSGATCPSCGTSLKTKPELAGRRVRCPKCSQSFQLPPAATLAPLADEVPVAKLVTTALPPVATPVVPATPAVLATATVPAIPPVAAPVASPVAAAFAAPAAMVIHSMPPVAVPLASPAFQSGVPQLAIDAKVGAGRHAARAGLKSHPHRRQPNGFAVILKILVLLAIFLAAAGLVVMRLQTHRVEFPIGLFLVAAGTIALGGVLFEWGFFFQHRKASFLVSLLGQGGARVFYGLLGSALCLVGYLELGGVIELKNADDSPTRVQRSIEPAAVALPAATSSAEQPGPLPTQSIRDKTSIRDKARRSRGTTSDKKSLAAGSPTPRQESPDDDISGMLPSFGGEAAGQAMPASAD